MRQYQVLWHHDATTAGLKDIHHGRPIGLHTDGPAGWQFLQPMGEPVGQLVWYGDINPNTDPMQRNVSAMVVIGQLVYDHDGTGQKPDWRFYPGELEHEPIPAVLIFYIHDDFPAARLWVGESGEDPTGFWLIVLATLTDTQAQLCAVLTVPRPRHHGGAARIPRACVRARL